MPVELLQELEVGEAEADGLDTRQQLVRAGRHDVLPLVEPQAVRPDELHGALCGGDRAHASLARTASGVASVGSSRSRSSVAGPTRRPISA